MNAVSMKRGASVAMMNRPVRPSTVDPTQVRNILNQNTSDAVGSGFAIRDSPGSTGTAAAPPVGEDGVRAVVFALW